MLTAERTTSGEMLALRLHGYNPRNTGGAAALPGRGDSINAASLSIPGSAKGISLPRDEYIPSFPELPPFEVSGKKQPEEAPAVEKPDTAEKPAGAETPGNAREPGTVEESARDRGELSEADLKIVAGLQNRDREVRAHEQAHISAGGAYIRGGASYEFEKGPDGKRYAVGGEVGIDSSPVRDNPQATMAKMQVVRSAALAPAEPSGQDRAVAAAATRNEAKAAAELRERQAAETKEAVDKAAQKIADSQNADNIKNTGDASNSNRSRIVSDAISAYAKSAAPQPAGGINKTNPRLWLG